MNEHDVVASVPMFAGVVGATTAECWFANVKKEIQQSPVPMCIRLSRKNSRGLNSFAYGLQSKLVSDPEYLNKFINLSQEFGLVSELIGINLK